MNRSIIGAVAIVMTLGGCAAGRYGNEGFDPVQVRRPDAHQPNIFVGNDGYLVVDQEPIRVPRSEGRVVIVWALPYWGSYTFADDGIQLADPVTHQPPPGTECAVQGTARKLYRCAYAAPLEPRSYKYSIKVNGAKSALEPWVYND
jgi:hypothetical protein